jgi:hypothetical protein
MTSWFKHEIVGSSRLVGGFHGIRAYFGVFQALSLSLLVCVCVCVYVLKASLAVR